MIQIGLPIPKLLKNVYHSQLSIGKIIALHTYIMIPIYIIIKAKNWQLGKLLSNRTSI